MTPEEALAEAVSDSLASATMGTDYAEAPEPSDEPGSPYVMRLTHELQARGVVRPTASPDGLRDTVQRLVDVGPQWSPHPDIEDRVPADEVWGRVTVAVADLRAALASSSSTPPLDVAAALTGLRRDVEALQRYEASSPLVYVETPNGSTLERAAVLALIRKALGEAPALPCTYRGCGKPEDDPVHPRPDERMGRGKHVYRNAALSSTPTEPPTGSE